MWKVQNFLLNDYTTTAVSDCGHMQHVGASTEGLKMQECCCIQCDISHNGNQFIGLLCNSEGIYE